MLETGIKDAEKFCRESSIPIQVRSGDSLHFAIVNENDEYFGTVSLKNIDLISKTAEYAIVLRKKAQRKGIGLIATGLILKKAFCEYDLHRVYLSVLSNNKPALSLYERSGFVYEGEFREHFRIEGDYLNWKWYGMLKNEYDENRFTSTDEG